MSGDTAIEWTDATWNPTTGCDRVSPGCDHCYAMTMAKRLKGMGQEKYQVDGDPATSGPGFLAHEWPRALDWPLHKTKPLRIFVNSMSDLFHANISDEYIAEVWAVMAHASQHTFQILTKRHARMRSLLSSDRFHDLAADAFERRGGPFDAAGPGIVLDNVWLGVSVENQHWADIRIPALLDTPASVRFLSCEPLLGRVDLKSAALRPYERQQGGYWHYGHGVDVYGNGKVWVPAPAAQIDWVIVGGESGPGARPMHADWARSLRDQCRAAGVPFLFKQWGDWVPEKTLSTGFLSDPRERHGELIDDGKHPEVPWRRVYRRVGKKAAGRELDGRTWDEYPAAVAQ